MLNNLDVVFDGLRLAIDVYEQVKAGNITAANAEGIINAWLDEVADIIGQTAPHLTYQFESFRANVVNTIFNILDMVEGQNWL